MHTSYLYNVHVYTQINFYRNICEQSGSRSDSGATKAQKQIAATFLMRAITVHQHFECSSYNERAIFLLHVTPTCYMQSWLLHETLYSCFTIRLLWSGKSPEIINLQNVIPLSSDNQMYGIWNTFVQRQCVVGQLFCLADLVFSFKIEDPFFSMEAKTCWGRGALQ